MSKERPVRLIQLLKDMNLVISLSESRRAVAQGAVTLNGVLKTDMSEEVVVKTGDILRVGRREFVLD